MKRLFCLTLLGLAVVGALEWQRLHRADRRREAATAPTSTPNAVSPQIREPVGWVFGRLIGVPGAKRPLLGENGLAEEGLTPPPSSTDRFGR